MDKIATISNYDPQTIDGEEYDMYSLWFEYNLYIKDKLKHTIEYPHLQWIDEVKMWIVSGLYLEDAQTVLEEVFLIDDNT